jgi:parallel beta-helix repeat protein
MEKTNTKPLSLIMLNILFFIIHANIYGTTWYVSTTGNNSNNGKSLAQAFSTIQHAESQTNPGDTVLVANGTYNQSISITRSGTSSAWITYKAINKHGATLNTSNSCFVIGGTNLPTSYIIIDGFELIATGVYGVGVGSGYGAHHLTVRNCWAHNCGQSGIQLNDGDYRTAENNICNNNSWLMPLCGSGISLWGLAPFDSLSGYHSIVKGNICYDNENGPATNQTDGEGIIIDDNRNTQSGHTAGSKNIGYTGCKVLVEDNLCYFNGGYGIEIYLSNNATVRNNTVWSNYKDRGNTGTWRSDLAASCSANILFYNNIAVANSNLRMDGETTNYSNFSNNSALGAYALSGDMYGANYTYYNNISYDINNTSSNSVTSNGITISFNVANGNKAATNPLFINPDTSSSIANFHLQSNSPAINAGTLSYGADTTDLDGNPRVISSTIDIGCYEQQISTTSMHSLNASINTVSIFPNPASDYCFLNSELLSDKKITVRFYNTIGQEIYTTQTSSKRIDVSRLQDGLYFYSLIIENEESIGEGKIIIQR